MKHSRSVFCALFSALFVALPASAAELDSLLETLRAVGPKGAGHREAIVAWRELSRAKAAQLPEILAGLDGEDGKPAGPLAANWIRAAVDTISERELRGGGKLPATELERFARDTQHAPNARRLAYELLCRVDRTAPQRLVPGMLDDPSLEMRRDAVARLIEQAAALEKTDQKEKALAILQKAFAASRDVDQIGSLAGRIDKLGGKIDLPRHFGFLLEWKLIGPFDNTGEKGYDVVYPPERAIDLDASYDGKHGEVQWNDYVSTDKHGKVDLNAACGKEKDVLAYATAEFFADAEHEVEFRSSSHNAIKLWLNGEPIGEHNIYHTGGVIDQYVNRGVLKPGRNVILLKVCQNAQTQSWAEAWVFQLRVCNQIGTAVLCTQRDK